jgi:hypothetical protein
MNTNDRLFNNGNLKENLETPQRFPAFSYRWWQAPWLTLQGLREVVRERGRVGAMWWVVSYAAPRKVLGVHFTQFAPGLCFGSQHTRWGRTVLQWRGFNAAVNMREDFDDLAHGLAFPAHLQPALQTEDIPEQVRLGLDFIHEQLSRGVKVFIHCSSGVHRAAAMALGCLVAQGWPASKAREHLIRCRRGVSIWPSREQEVLRGVEAFLAGRAKMPNL